MIAARITRRLVRKLAKPAALWLTQRALRRAEARADYFLDLRNQVVPFELAERKRAVQLTARRNHIQGW
jgi:Holliday junction resolvase-like predicted endonuclease